MDAALVIITLASLGTTGAVLLYAARLIRDERTRSQARVAALAEEIGRAPGPSSRTSAPISGAPLERRTAREQAPRDAAAAGAPPSGTRPTITVSPEPRRAAPGRDVLADAALFPARHTRPEADGVALPAHAVAGTLFESGAPESPSNRWLVPVIGAMIVILALTTIYFVSGGSDGAPNPARAKAAATSLPLDLVSLSQTRAGDTLTVSGLVRNPRTAAERRQVAAVVFLFDRNGSFVASGRAPLDYQALAPGDESPFVITVPGAADVSRYRVSFREGDEVLPHVDRRDAAGAGGGPAGKR
jgi:hypothetical protein